ncbi:hypothetical protein [Halopseudomonas maritima]|uniref:hypothetical protein n=1 Tax=Halopseudomonas maritima TaxID=2918528 RepID=UPI001EECD49A|nr:hypothetical protein [Halopseudomonas maritima]UJJ31811.1 hypothetical protein HV822_01105 [Halopseudomonas maritima]
MRNAVRKTHSYLTTKHALGENNAISMISVAVDFGMTQVADGNLGMHATIFTRRCFPRTRAAKPNPAS